MNLRRKSLKDLGSREKRRGHRLSAPTSSSGPSIYLQKQVACYEGLTHAQRRVLNTEIFDKMEVKVTVLMPCMHHL